MSPVTSLVMATTNVGKIREICHEWQIGGIQSIGVASLFDYPGYESPPEDQPSFIGNAILKALAAARHTGTFAMADDSGLCVATLGGAPGVYSARYAGSGATDDENNAKLVAELRRQPQLRHAAAYVCVMAIASPTGILAAFTGRMEGEILISPRGSGGFGYDPYFFLADVNCTAAELTIEKKSQISHRGKALRAAITWLSENASRLPDL